MLENKWKLALCLAVVFLTVGCGNKEQETIPTQEPEVTQEPQATPIVFKPLGNTVIKQTEGLAEHLEKTDAAEQAGYNAMNRMLSYDEQGNQSLFCIDADTGVVYFVNQNKDFYIYRIKDGVTELAVSIPARALYTYDGALYFMVESYGKYTMEEMKDGDIYRYTPEDGKVELVYAFGEEVDGKTCKMLVNENGIYFSFSERGEEQVVDGETSPKVHIISCCLPFGATEAVPDDSDMTIVPRWRDYKLGSFKFKGDTSTQPSPLALLRWTEEEKDYRELSVGRPKYYCVMGDSLYCYMPSTQDAGLIVLDLVTGERKEYRVWEALKKVYSKISESAMAGEQVTEMSDKELAALLSEEGVLYGKRLIDCFTATKQYFWLSINSGSYLIRIDRENGDMAVFKIKGFVEMLYTDGEQLYGMCATTYEGIYSMARILTERPAYNEVTEEEYVEVQYLTK